MNTAKREKGSDAIKRERRALLAQLEHAVAPTEPEYTIETIHIRAHTVTLVLEEVLHNCPLPHWEINDQSTATTKPGEAEKEGAEKGEDI